MNSLPSLTALRCFDASAHHQSFTRAAKQVHLTQGAVSHQILGLEAQLGVSLFTRSKNGLQLTQAGAAYWVEVAAALRQIERATQNVVMTQGNAGVLNLCVASSFATYWLIPRLSGFVSLHPEITLNLSTQIGPIDFASTSHDAAIEYCAGAKETKAALAPSLHAHLVAPLCLKPYASIALVGSKVRSKQKGLGTLLRSVPLIRHSTVPQAWSGWLHRAKLAEHIETQHLQKGPQYDLLSMALNGCIAGLGIALLPSFLTLPALKAHQLVALSEISWTSDKSYYLRYPEWKAQLSALEKFQQWLSTQQ